MIDTHAHLTAPPFSRDCDAVIAAAKKAGVSHIITVGTDLETSRQAVALAEKYACLYAAVGIHPQESAQLPLEAVEDLHSLLSHPKVVAIGEIGLDRHFLADEKAYEHQKTFFTHQLILAQTYAKPVILHVRDLKEDVLKLIPTGLPGVFHCFEGSKKYLKQVVAAGFYVSFTGLITYTPDRLGVAATLPLDRLLLETDSPLLAPLPHRGERNQPAYVPMIAAAHAQIRGLTINAIAQATSSNARQLFKFPPA